MLSGALNEILREGLRGERLSLSQIHDRTWALIKHRYKTEAVRPELHSPEQLDGDIAKLPLFPVLLPSGGHGALLTERRSRFLDALDPRTFNSLKTHVNCVVVLAELQTAEGVYPLEEHVRLAWENDGSEIESAFLKDRSMRIYSRPATDAGSVGSP